MERMEYTHWGRRFVDTSLTLPSFLVSTTFVLARIVPLVLSWLSKNPTGGFPRNPLNNWLTTNVIQHSSVICGYVEVCLWYHTSDIFRSLSSPASSSSRHVLRTTPLPYTVKNKYQQQDTQQINFAPGEILRVTWDTQTTEESIGVMDVSGMFFCLFLNFWKPLNLKRCHDSGRVGKRETLITSPDVSCDILVCDTTGGVRSSITTLSCMTLTMCSYTRPPRTLWEVKDIMDKYWGQVGDWVRRSELCVQEKRVCHLLRLHSLSFIEISW